MVGWVVECNSSIAFVNVGSLRPNDLVLVGLFGCVHKTKSLPCYNLNISFACSIIFINFNFLYLKH